MTNNTTNSFPEAVCATCYTTARIIKHMTFSYFFCDKCKDEPVVLLKTTMAPKHGRSEYDLSRDNDIVIDKPGLYRIEHTDGSFEWYEHCAHTRRIRLRGDAVRIAHRIADSDMPSRKSLLSLSEASKGAEAEGQSLRTVSNEADSLTGCAKAASSLFTDPRDYLSVSGISIIPCAPNGTVPYYTTSPLLELEQSDKRVQHGKVPPDDSL